MFGSLVGPDIKEMLDARQFAELRRALASLPAVSVAEIFTDMSPEDVAVLFRILPREFAADIFEYLAHEQQEVILRALGQEGVAAVLNEMAPDDRTALLEDLPGPVTQKLILLLSPEERRIATKLLGYPEKSIGRRMTPDYVAVREGMTIGEVLDHIRRVGRDKETLNVIYVVDERGRLVDDIRLRELILADPAKRMSDIMDRQYQALRVDQDQEDAVKEFKRLDRSALPVVDGNDTLVGMVTVDDILDVEEKVVTEDIQRMGAVQALEAPYMNVGFFEMVRKRVVWLALLLVGGMFTATAMGYFQDELDHAMVLGLFIPLVLSSGGNSGSQASTLIIRALALEEIKLHDWWRILYREIGSGLALGLTLGILVFLRIGLWPGAEKVYTVHYWWVAAAVSTSVIGVVVYGTVVGSMLPLILRRVGLDPAVSSTPFVATLVDVSGIIIYFTMAAVLLRGLLL
ncbi:MAG TPA: magnesium transporter [Phycisphaerae bacterium]|nr:magnesium transporter [Phycisphaerae bacterium]